MRTTDNRDSTPLHWACYSKSEVALVYLLSYVEVLDDQDVEGYTPLHLAVKSVETLQTSRPVRALLMRGAPRDKRDNLGRTPADLISEITSPSLQKTLKDDLDNPRGIDCFMLKPPLKKVERSYLTVCFMWFLMFSVYTALTIFVFPCKSHTVFLSFKMSLFVYSV